jgi:ubiquinone/menaquinone biosynthesis C-methylase UbiE
MLPFRKGSKHSLAVAMTGVKLGDRLLMIGCTDASLLSAIAGKVGLSGRVCAVVPDESSASRARRGAEQGGILLEIERNAVETLPFEDGAFNLIVVDAQDGLLWKMQPEPRQALFRDAFRASSPRGRIVVIERRNRPGFGGLLKRSAPPVEDQAYEVSGGSLSALQEAGFRAARLLAERDGLSFFEGVR